MLVSCGNPSSLTGTKWENAQTGAFWSFTTAKDVTFNAGSASTDYTYTYDGEYVTFTIDLFGTSTQFAKAKVEGSKFEITGVVYKKK